MFTVSFENHKFNWFEKFVETSFQDVMSSKSDITATSILRMRQLDAVCEDVELL